MLSIQIQISKSTLAHIEAPLYAVASSMYRGNNDLFNIDIGLTKIYIEHEEEENPMHKLLFARISFWASDYVRLISRPLNILPHFVFEMEEDLKIIWGEFRN